MGTNTFHSNLYTAITALGLIGIVIPFLPFTEHISPLQAVEVVARPEDFIPVTIAFLGVPFFLAILVSIASLRLVVFGEPSRSELAIEYCSSMIAACATLFMTIDMASKSTEPTEWFCLSVVWATIVGGSTLVVRSWRKGVTSGLIAVAAMQIAYVANALLCLVAFWPGWQIGAKLTLFTLVVYVGQVPFVVLRKSLLRPANAF